MSLSLVYKFQLLLYVLIYELSISFKSISKLSLFTGSQVGTIIAMPLSGLLAETALGWKMIFYVTSAIMFLTAALWYWFAASTPGEHSMMTEEEKTYIEMGLDTSTETRVRILLIISKNLSKE